MSLPQAVLCRVVPSEVTDVALRKEKVALLQAVMSAEDLLGGDGLRWAQFLNRFTYAEKTGRTMFLWMGDGIINLEGLDARCQSIMHSNNHLKPLAFVALLRAEPVESFLYLDADAWFSEVSDRSLPEKYLEVAPAADVIFTQGHTTSVLDRRGIALIDDGVAFVRNTDFGRKFSEMWWSFRCDGFDESSNSSSSLFRAAFQMLKESQINFHFSEEQFESYDGAHWYTLQHFKNVAYSSATPGPWDCVDKSCWKSNILVMPIEVGQVLILPLTATKLGDGVVLPAVTQDIYRFDANVFICSYHITDYAKLIGADNNCGFEDICSKQKCGGWISDEFLKPSKLGTFIRQLRFVTQTFSGDSSLVWDSFLSVFTNEDNILNVIVLAFALLVMLVLYWIHWKLRDKKTVHHHVVDA
eukprot:gnl/MRDRNA2_/MRDRNA2_79444_c0_seq2.p1 gnl/MRDRNA2_/MRDRNA2_79444_c0~~gnl/MRDRNA2_/MRDRNA2_79444_c0_seq2.p1  ORF type:complete len:413 (-),score=66.80 gnl/MRDRNA2_/MRDRNA2_79444_c0_seq2:110-1348(-)